VFDELVAEPAVLLTAEAAEEVDEEEPPQAAQAIATTAEAMVRISWRLIGGHPPGTT